MPSTKVVLDVVRLSTIIVSSYTAMVIMMRRSQLTSQNYFLWPIRNRGLLNHDDASCHVIYLGIGCFNLPYLVLYTYRRYLTSITFVNFTKKSIYDLFSTILFWCSMRQRPYNIFISIPWFKCQHDFLWDYKTFFTTFPAGNPGTVAGSLSWYV